MTSLNCTLLFYPHNNHSFFPSLVCWVQSRKMTTLHRFCDEHTQKNMNELCIKLHSHLITSIKWSFFSLATRYLRNNWVTALPLFQRLTPFSFRQCSSQLAIRQYSNEKKTPIYLRQFVLRWTHFSFVLNVTLLASIVHKIFEIDTEFRISLHYLLINWLIVASMTQCEAPMYHVDFIAD